ncbi:MAG TPA: uroporphyrinogen-III synthase [Anaerolineales bacterium]|nr:uroporphyrinogen-III synthase [Anaerolineales bacterium]
MDARKIGILVTRPQPQAQPLIDGLAQLGLAVWHLPLIRIQTVPPSPMPAWTGFDGALFSSAHAVQAARETLPPEFWHWLASVPVGVVGTATATSLRQNGIQPVLVPGVHSAQGLSAELLAQPNKLGKKILHLCGNLTPAAFFLPLTQVGIFISPCVLYRTSTIHYPKADWNTVCQQVDWLTFASGSAVQAFVENAGTGRHKKVAFCLGKHTQQTAQAVGFGNTVLASENSNAGLLASVADYWVKLD